MKTLKKAGCLALALMMGLSVLGGCGSKKDDVIRIGAVGPLTGDSSNGASSASAISSAAK